MATISYRLSGKKDKAAGKAQILVDVSVSRNFRVRGKTRIHVQPNEWDEKNGCIKKASRVSKIEKQVELQELTKTLNRLREHISTLITDAQDRKELDEMTTPDSRQKWIEYVVASFYDPCVVLTRNNKLSFQDFADVYVKVRSQEEGWKLADMSSGNKKKVWDHPCYDKLCAVQTQVRKMNPDLLMDEITAQTVDDYQAFLIDKGYLNSTIQNHISYFKQILMWAYDRGYLKHGKEIAAHKAKSLKMSKPKAVNFLRWDEFLELYNYKFAPGQGHLELTRDRFCFCCATSLRHSDLELLKKVYFDDWDNPSSFSMMSKKTNDDLTIFLNKYSKDLYLKYRDVPTPDGLLFPPKSNQKMNDNLKEIAKMLGFTRDISKMQFSGRERVEETNRLCDVIGTHSARRTFVVHALEQGWSPQLVMTFTGHEDYDSMKPYIALTDKVRKDMMTNNF